MKKVLFAFGVLALAACGGGGSSPSSTPPVSNPNPPPAVPTSSPTPTPSPSPSPIANTALPYYLPLGAGNSWTFASGGKLQDVGAGTLSCTCPGNGGKMEQIGLYASNSSTATGSFFFTKNTPAGATQLTNLIGVSAGLDTTAITLASTAQFPYGLPIMDDSPSANEFWNDAGALSTITAVGGSMLLPNGQKIVNVATDQITGSFNPITWSFAQGVGFTQIGVGSETMDLSSFYVNPQTSYSSVRRGQAIRLFYGRFGRIDVRSLLRKLL